MQGITTILLTASLQQPELQIMHRKGNTKSSGKMQTQITWPSLHTSVHKGRKRTQRLPPQLVGLMLSKFEEMWGGTGSFCSARASVCLWSQQILLKHVISLRWRGQQRKNKQQQKKTKTGEIKKIKTTQHTSPFTMWPWVTVSTMLLLPQEQQVSDLTL